MKRLLDRRDQVSRLGELVDDDFGSGHFGQQHVIGAIIRGDHEGNVIRAQAAY